MKLAWNLCLVGVVFCQLASAVPLPVPDQGDKSSAEKSDESKVYMDMLKMLQEVEQSQVQLQAAVADTDTAKAPQAQALTQQNSERRKDEVATGGLDPATPSKLLHMETIVKALENVASTLSKGSKGLLADATASATDDAVLRNERDSGYGAPSYGPNTVAETPNNFINVFSQAAANTVNFGTQLLNSLVGVAANILQGTVSTLLSLLNAKGQIVGAVVQSAPPVLASVTRTAGDVLAAKARIFGAVTQSAVNFASQLAQTVTNTFSGLFNGASALNFNALAGRSGSEGTNPLGGFGNFAQTIVNSQLNLLNGILSPFTGRGNAGLNLGGGFNPLAALFRPRGGRNNNNNGDDDDSKSSNSEPNFRITIGASTAAPEEKIEVPSEPEEK